MDLGLILLAWIAVALLCAGTLMWCGFDWLIERRAIRQAGGRRLGHRPVDLPSSSLG